MSDFNDESRWTGHVEPMPDPYQEAKKMKETNPDSVRALFNKKEADAEAFEEELINKAAAELSLLETVHLKPFPIVEQAENIVYEEQEEDEWGRASYTFTFEWFSEQFLDGNYIDGWVIDPNRRIVSVQAAGPDLPEWHEGQEPVELACETTYGPLHDREKFESGIMSVDEVRESMGYDPVVDEWEDFDTAEDWEKGLYALAITAFVFILVVILAKGVWM